MQNRENRSVWKKVTFSACLFVAALSIFVYLSFFSSPKHKSPEIVVVVDSGQSLRSISIELKNEGVVRSALVAQSLMVFFGREGNIPAGIYVFKGRQNVFTVARRIVEGDYGFVPVKLTVPEGTSSYRLAALVNSKFPHIATSSFELLAKAREGYLFPETYFFAPVETPESIIRRMSEAFDDQISKYEAEIKKSGKTREEIIKMASILEAEVQTDKDRAMVADLLWRRLGMGMALQVDCTLGYVLHKTSAELTRDDLQLETPYNSYVYKGLPPTPISNPGAKSIEAALRPEANEYLFYLSDKDGITHFSETYEGHLFYKRKYLR